jgi:hypothetical protein
MRALRLGVAILLVLTTLPLVSRAESAEPDIKVLLLTPRHSAGVPVDAAADLEQNIRMTGSVVPVDELSKADVLVELSQFNRKVKQGGDSEFLWEGHFLALLPSPGADRFVPKPEPFTIRMIGPDESSKRKAAEALGRILVEALGRAPRNARGTI